MPTLTRHTSLYRKKSFRAPRTWCASAHAGAGWGQQELVEAAGTALPLWRTVKSEALLPSNLPSRLFARKQGEWCECASLPRHEHPKVVLAFGGLGGHP